MQRFIHLRNHSDFSCLEGLLKHRELADLCREYQMPAVAVTNVKSLAGAMDFSLVLSNAGIQPILGCTLPFTYEHQEGDMSMLVQNEEGYRNLIWLLSRIRKGLDIESLLEESGDRVAGLICLTGGSRGFLSNCLQSVPILCQLFRDRLYVELNRFEDSPPLENEFLAVARDNSIPIVATNDCYFAKQDLCRIHDVLLCIKHGKKITDETREKVSSQQYFKSVDEMVSLFKDLPEAVENTEFIAKRCSFMLRSRNPQLPNFNTGSETQEQALRGKAETGLRKRIQELGIEAHEEYEERLNHELGVISGMNFAGYFLIVADFVSWAKENAIPVGPGRGSGSASIVSWSLGITDLDPVKFRLIFERFLNPDRVSLPDFDIDFCPDARDKVINYVREKYGEDKVGQIVTFGRLNTRAVVRDVGRALSKPFALVEKLAKMIPFQPANPLTLQQGLDRIPLLKEAIASEGLEEMFEIALALEGIPRHESVHAAGIVITNESLYDQVPVIGNIEEKDKEKDKNKESLDDMPIIQLDMKDVERAGLVKFDFLGLKTLTVMADCENSIKNDKGQSLDWKNVPFDDRITYELMQTGATTGVFQLESVGMQSLLRRLRPDNLEDIMASIALFRPGPMQNIPKYVACKHDGSMGKSLHPIIDKILQDTYGIIVYQEQVIEIAQRFAGYSASEADILRRVIGKKKRDEMESQKESFVQGAVKTNEVSNEDAESVFDLIQTFASYGFNRAHAAGYAVIAYRMCWIKVHHPEVFFAASMTQDVKDLEKIALFKHDMQALRVTLLPPHINHSRGEFFVESFENKEIRFGMYALKGMSAELANEVANERDKNGAYKSPLDFIKRMIQHGNSIDKKLINRKSIEILGAAGAFDGLGMTREQVCEKSRHQSAQGYDVLLDTAASSMSSQGSLFDSVGKQEAELDTFSNSKWSSFEKASHEHRTMGMYFCEHPASEVRKKVSKVELYSELVRRNLEEGERTKITFGVIINKMEHKRWGNRHVLLLTVSDPSANFYVQVDRPELVKEVMAQMDKEKYNLAILVTDVVMREGRILTSVGGLSWYDANTGKLSKMVEGGKFSPPTYSTKPKQEHSAAVDTQKAESETSWKKVQNLETLQEILDKSESRCVQVRVVLSGSSQLSSAILSISKKKNNGSDRKQDTGFT